MCADGRKAESAPPLTCRRVSGCVQIRNRPGTGQPCTSLQCIYFPEGRFAVLQTNSTNPSPILQSKGPRSSQRSHSPCLNCKLFAATKLIQSPTPSRGSPAREWLTVAFSAGGPSIMRLFTLQHSHAGLYSVGSCSCNSVQIITTTVNAAPRAKRTMGPHLRFFIKRSLCAQFHPSAPVKAGTNLLGESDVCSFMFSQTSLGASAGGQAGLCEKTSLNHRHHPFLPS